MDEPEASLEMARSRNWAFAGFLLAATSMVLPWWVIRGKEGGRVVETVANTPWKEAGPLTQSWGPWVAGILLAITVLWLFIRLAGRSFAHEPAAWMRDLRLQAGVLVVAVLQALFWSADDSVPGFWDQTSHEINGTGTFIVTAAPGLGWWCAILGVLCLVAAILQARQAPNTTAE